VNGDDEFDDLVKALNRMLPGLNTTAN